MPRTTKTKARKTVKKPTKRIHRGTSNVTIKNKNIIINKTVRTRKPRTTSPKQTPVPRQVPNFIPFYQPPPPPSNITIHHHNPVPQPLQSVSVPVPLVTERETVETLPVESEVVKPIAIKTPIKTPVKNEPENRFSLLDSDVTTPVIATPIVEGYPDIEIHKIFKKYKIPEVQEKEPIRETDWNIKTFIRHNVPFLFRMNFIDPDSDPNSLPSSEDIYRQLKDYVVSNALFEIPSQKTRGNKNKEFRSVFYKKLHNYIHKGTLSSTMKSGIKQYLRNPEVFT